MDPTERENFRRAFVIEARISQPPLEHDYMIIGPKGFFPPPPPKEGFNCTRSSKTYNSQARSTKAAIKVASFFILANAQGSTEEAFKGIPKKKKELVV